MRGKFISYLRVSTDKQGVCGYGIAAQSKAVKDYLDGGKWELLDEFIEVESGRRNDRPQLVRALVACKKHKAKLVIAKLDRLARNVAFIATLMDGNVEFVCCDMPQATKLTIHVLAAVAEHEREAIVQRTKEGLSAAKARGVKLGNPVLAAANRAAALERAKALRPILSELADLSATACAAELNRRGAPTPAGGRWHAGTVIRVRVRLAGPC
jgi:DNA invertase Pin-like site-specific DNA recombinase